MRKAFTLIELLVVVAMIAAIMGALTTSVSAAQERARIQKATSEVKIISQAILSYEHYAQGHELPVMADRDADSNSLGFLLGKGATSGTTGDQIPVLLMASLSAGGQMKDPWGTPYKIRITAGTGNVKITTATENLRTGFFYPNFYRLGEDERQ